MAGDIVLQLRDSRYPGQFEMRNAAADEIERLRLRTQVSAVSQADFSMLVSTADMMGFGRTHDALRRIIAVLPYSQSAPVIRAAQNSAEGDPSVMLDSAGAGTESPQGSAE